MPAQGRAEDDERQGPHHCGVGVLQTRPELGQRAGAHPAAGHQIGNDRNRNGAGPEDSEAGDRDYLLVEADRRTARSRSGPLRTATWFRWASDPEVAAWFDAAFASPVARSEWPLTCLTR